VEPTCKKYSPPRLYHTTTGGGGDLEPWPMMVEAEWGDDRRIGHKRVFRVYRCSWRIRATSGGGATYRRTRGAALAWVFGGYRVGPTSMLNLEG
jgi:hypothetical protein